MIKLGIIKLNDHHLSSASLSGQKEVVSNVASGGGGIVPLPPSVPEPEQPESKYIQFADAEVERVLMSKGVSSDGVGITIEDAERVTSISKWFLNNTTIVSFNELRYFTALTEVSPLNESGYGASAFRGATNLREITIPRNVSRLGTYCFSKCSSLAKVTFEDANKITDINSYAFADCSALVAEVDFPNLSVLGANAFGKCSSLTKVVSLGNVSILNGSSTTGMTQGEFYGCTSLSEINLPSSLTSVGINSFRNCSGLTGVVCRATTPPSLANVSAFNNTNNCPIYVPDASLEAYKTATNWNAYADRIRPISEIEGGVVTEMGYELKNDGTLSQNDAYFVVGFIPIVGGHSIKWSVPNGKIGNLCEYDSEGKKLDYWGGQSKDTRTITTKSSTTQIKCCFSVTNKEYAYILDTTTNEYLWKGANVE